MEEKIYRHYVSESRDDIYPRRYDPEVLRASVKPYAPMPMFHGKPDGLWASPIESEYSWKDFVEGEMEEEFVGYFDFMLKEHSRILHVTSNSDVDEYYIDYPMPDEEASTREIYRSSRLAFPKHSSNGAWKPSIYSDYDGLELHYSDNPMELRYGRFYLWDVDSIVIWNPDIIIPLF